MSQETSKQKEEERVLQEALSPIVNRLIDKNFENSGDKMASHMAPLIGGAIREQIKSQKDDIVDALYPVMGNMISKFVTKSIEDLLQKINAQIQNGLSVKAIKRKLTAKLKGVSESELLLQENSIAKIKTVLLIHKESGTLLCKVENENNQLNDADMLASMMTAIRSFVNDWVSRETTNNELGEIEYGGNKIIIEASGYSYLAVIVEGATSLKTYTRIRHVLEKIVLEYGDAIKSFDGNLQSFPKDKVKPLLEELLTNTIQTKDEKKASTKPLLFTLLGAFMIVGGYLFYNHYEDNKIEEKALQSIQNTPALALFNIHATVNDRVVTLQGNVPFEYYKELTQKRIKGIPALQGIKNKIMVVSQLKDPMQISSNIFYLLQGYNQIKNNHITYKFDYNNLTLLGTIASKKLKTNLLDALKKIEGIEKITDNIKIITPKIEKNIYFSKASTKLEKNAKEKLTQLAKDIVEYAPKSTVMLLVYSDALGDNKKNQQLSMQRADAIANFLHTEANLTNTINKKLFETPPPGVDAHATPDRARCVKITLQKVKK